MMFLDCPACLDDERTVTCGLPAEVRCQFTMCSSDGPLEAAMIRCPAGHCFNGPIESLTCDSTNRHDPGTAPAASTFIRHGSLPPARDGQRGVALDEFPAGPGRAARRPNCAPAYYLGRTAHLWITAMRRSRPAPSHPMQAAAGRRAGTPPPGGALVTGARTGTAPMTPATASWQRG